MIGDGLHFGKKRHFPYVNVSAGRLGEERRGGERVAGNSAGCLHIALEYHLIMQQQRQQQQQGRENSRCLEADFIQRRQPPICYTSRRAQWRPFSQVLKGKESRDPEVRVGGLEKNYNKKGKRVGIALRKQDHKERKGEEGWGHRRQSTISTIERASPIRLNPTQYLLLLL